MWYIELFDWVNIIMYYIILRKPIKINLFSKYCHMWLSPNLNSV